MRRAYFIFYVTVLIGHCASGQSGNYFLSHYAPTDENIDYLSFDIVQSEKGIIYFANKNGVVEFDGRNWDVIESPGAIYSLAIANGNDLYYGGLTGFGKLALADNGTTIFQSLSTDVSAGNIFKSKTLGKKVYFLNEGHLYVFNIETQSIELTIDAKPDASFTGMYELDGALYLADVNSSLHKLDKGQLIPASLAFLDGEELLFVDKLIDSTHYLIGTASNRLFSYSSAAAIEINSEDSGYLQDNVVVGGKWVNENLIAIGTLSGGVVFINPVTGTTEEIINYYTGLPDNEVFALMTDFNQGVWVGHDYGFTRIAPYLPFRTFNHYPGLSGNLLTAYSDDNLVYVGTSVGLFKLNKEEVYSEETYYVTRLRKTTVEEEKTERKKSRRGLFGFLKKNKDQEEEKGGEEPDQKQGIKKVVEKRTRKVLETLDYGYKKVAGIEGKVTHFMNVEGKFIAAGVGGVFEIEGLEATPVFTMPVRTIFYSPSLKQLLVSTYNDRIRTLRNNEDKWEETFLLDTLRAYVGNIFEDHIQNIWLCGRADVVKVELVDAKISTISSVPFATTVLDETMGFSQGVEVFVAASGAFHRYDVINHVFVKYDSLPGPRKYFTSMGTFWYNDGHKWGTVDANLKNRLNLQWLGLFPDIRTLTMADNGSGLWLITSNNELYKFTRSELREIAKSYPLFLKKVRGSESKLLLGNLFSIDQRESALSFEFVQPEYTNALAIEYQYMIEGISKSWSDWSTTNNVVNFPFLTPGSYKLRIKSRDLFGVVSELKPVDFRVIPPYWKQTWFYALEFVFFASLVFLSLKLSAANRKYRYISQLLSILTVIMLIQLVQNTAESFIEVQTTPVMDFFIQVFIALLILPLEYKMRELMTKASEGQYDLKRLKRVKP
ncbi:MAG TPA: triple tyrosine motif-containing protein [Cyclobacteriaceae bacterium]|nr:triple tyrosine motif-containing protein [Cyclobacteriaceae bacterium]